VTLQSYKFTTVEYSGKTHEIEARGHTPGKAARRLGEADSRIVRVLDTDPRHIGDPRKWKKLVWYRKGHEQDASETEIGQKMMAARLDTASMILTQLTASGVKLDVREEPQEDGTVSRSIITRSQCQPTEEQLGEIQAHSDSLIALLLERKSMRAEHAVPAAPKPSRSPQRQLVIDLLPELGKGCFQRYDVERLLHKAQHHELADNTPSLDFLLADLTKRGLLTRVKMGVYRVTENEIDKAPDGAPPLELQPAPAPTPVPPQEPPVVAAPEAVQQPVPSPALGELKNPLDLIVGLSSALLGAPLDSGEVDAVEAAMSRFENEMLEAIEKVRSAFRPVIQQLRSQNNARRYLRDQIAAPPTN
jgi:hypothetical protein